MNKKVISGGGGPQDSLDKLGCPPEYYNKRKEKKEEKNKKKEKEKKNTTIKEKNIGKRDEIKALRTNEIY